MNDISDNAIDVSANRGYWLILFYRLTIVLVVIFLLLFLYDSIVSTWQQTLLKSAHQLVNEKPNVVLMEEVKEEQSRAMLSQPMDPQSVKSMAFSDIILPDLPNVIKIKDSVEIAQNDTDNNGQSNVSVVKESVIKEVQPADKALNQGLGEQTAKVYHQLISDQSLSIEIAWPEQIHSREKLFNYLYQCVGVRFGVLNQHGVTLAKQTSQQRYTPITPKTKHSEWLRIAQGSLGSNEQKWLTQYKLSGTPIRLFPKNIDWQLAHLVAEHLGGKLDKQGKALVLKNLRAKYKLVGQRLMLDNININNEKLNQSWLLVETNCLI
jgi:hypothetical protein